MASAASEFACFDVDARSYTFVLLLISRLNTCPFQGSRTIRTEEAIIISLSRLNPFLISAQAGGTKASSTITVAELDKKRVLPEIEFNDDVSSEESD